MRQNLLILICLITVHWFIPNTTAQSLASVDLATQPIASDYSVQQQEEKQSLAKVLNDLQKQYQVLFNYDPSVVTGREVLKQIPQQHTASGIEATLTTYLLPLRLKYKKLRDDYFIIYKPDESKLKKIPPLQSSGTNLRQLSVPKPNLSVAQLSENIRTAFLTVSGKVTDSATGESIPEVMYW